MRKWNSRCLVVALAVIAAAIILSIWAELDPEKAMQAVTWVAGIFIAAQKGHDAVSTIKNGGDKLAKND